MSDIILGGLIALALVAGFIIRGVTARKKGYDDAQRDFRDADRTRAADKERLARDAMAGGVQPSDRLGSRD